MSKCNSALFMFLIPLNKASELNENTASFSLDFLYAWVHKKLIRVSRNEVPLPEHDCAIPIVLYDFCGLACLEHHVAWAIL
jgi:hypothetical protein